MEAQIEQLQADLLVARQHYKELEDQQTKHIDEKNATEIKIEALRSILFQESNKTLALEKQLEAYKAEIETLQKTSSRAGQDPDTQNIHHQCEERLATEKAALEKTIQLMIVDRQHLRDTLDEERKSSPMYQKILSLQSSMEIKNTAEISNAELEGLKAAFGEEQSRYIMLQTDFEKLKERSFAQIEESRVNSESLIKEAETLKLELTNEKEKHESTRKDLTEKLDVQRKEIDRLSSAGQETEEMRSALANSDKKHSTLQVELAKALDEIESMKRNSVASPVSSPLPVPASDKVGINNSDLEVKLKEMSTKNDDLSKQLFTVRALVVLVIAILIAYNLI